MKMIKLNQRSKLPLVKTLIPIKEKICITTQAGQIIIRKQDILYLQADSNYCIIHFNDTKLICSQTLKLLESRLQSHNFIRVHKSYLVNFDKIRFVDNAFTRITMEDRTEIPISRSNKQIVKSLLFNQFD